MRTIEYTLVLSESESDHASFTYCSFVKSNIRILAEKLKRQNPDIQAIVRELMLISSLPDSYERYWLYPIDELEISKGLKNVLKLSEINFIGELVQKTQEEVSTILVLAKRNVEKDLKSIKQKLWNRGLYLGVKFREW